MRTSAREIDRRQLLAELVDLGLDLVGLAELLLDRLELLAQEILALALVELGLDLGLDLRPKCDHLELARQDLRETAQPLGHVDLLEKLLLLVGRQAQRTGDQMREDARVVDVGDHHLELVGEVRDLFDDVREGLLDVAHQRRELRRLLDHVGGRRDISDQIGLGTDPVLDPDALATLDQHPQRAVRYADHPRHDA